MAIKYRIEDKTGSPASLSDLNQWLKEGYELIAALAHDQNSGPPKYIYYLVYKGGARPHGAVRSNR